MEKEIVETEVRIYYIDYDKFHIESKKNDGLSEIDKSKFYLSSSSKEVTVQKRKERFRNQVIKIKEVHKLENAIHKANNKRS